MNLKKIVKRNRKLVGFLIGFCSVLVLFIGTSLGRYAYREIRDFYLESNSFYFSSDKLDESMVHYELDNWSGADQYDVIFYMNSYKNNKVFADSDISYEIEYRCSSNVICESTKDSGIIRTTTHTDSFVITITPVVSLQDGDSVSLEVFAKATDPYTKTLRGKFVMNVGKMGLDYEILDESNRPYLEFNITNTLDFYSALEDYGDYSYGDRLDINGYLSMSEEEREHFASATITLRFDPSVVVLDMTTSAYLKAISTSVVEINGYNYINEITFRVDALSSESVRFYKSNALLDYSYPFENNEPVIEFSYS